MQTKHKEFMKKTKISSTCGFLAIVRDHLCDLFENRCTRRDDATKPVREEEAKDLIKFFSCSDAVQCRLLRVQP